jgi:hypothetical protein
MTCWTGQKLAAHWIVAQRRFGDLGTTGGNLFMAGQHGRRPKGLADPRQRGDVNVVGSDTKQVCQRCRVLCSGTLSACDCRQERASAPRLRTP